MTMRPAISSVQENKGLKAMFVMMNEARLGVGVQGLAQSEVAYQNAVDYAKERIQGRSISGTKAPDKKADPIIVHPDIRRILMRMKSFNEAARALVLWTALKGDIHHRSDDTEAKEAADELMGLLTPIVKGVITDRGFRQCRRGAAGLWRPWLCRGMGHEPVRARCPYCS